VLRAPATTSDGPYGSSAARGQDVVAPRNVRFLVIAINRAGGVGKKGTPFRRGPGLTTPRRTPPKFRTYSSNDRATSIFSGRWPRAPPPTRYCVAAVALSRRIYLRFRKSHTSSYRWFEFAETENAYGGRFYNISFFFFFFLSLRSRPIVRVTDAQQRFYTLDARV